ATSDQPDPAGAKRTAADRGRRAALSRRERRRSTPHLGCIGGRQRDFAAPSRNAGRPATGSPATGYRGTFDRGYESRGSGSGTALRVERDRGGPVHERVARRGRAASGPRNDRASGERRFTTRRGRGNPRRLSGNRSVGGFR